MALSQFARKTAWCWFLAVAIPAFVQAQSGFVTEGNEYNISGALPGDQVFPAVSLKTSGGFLVWQDNRTDGDGFGLSALRLDSSFSALLSPFRVTQQSTFDQAQACVSLLNDGGAAFVWQGGRQGFQHIFARFLSSSNTWATDDIPVNTYSNNAQINPAVVTLTNGNVVVVWGSFNQQSPTSLQDVYAQRFSPTGQKLGGEFLVNLTTAYNQRSPAIAPLSDGRYVVVWVSEQQRSVFNTIPNNTNGAPLTQLGTASVDIYARLFTASGGAASDEFLINSSMNVCASPSVAPSSDGGFIVAWMQKDLITVSNSWDVWARPFSGSAFGGVTRRVNTQEFGDQLAPQVSSVGSQYMVVWTSMGQDGSREGVYGQFLQSDGSLAGSEFRVNTTTASQQIHPALASDGNGRFLTVWSSFVGGGTSFDLYAQRYASTNQPLYAPSPPFVTALSSNTLSVTWSPQMGYSIANYEVYADNALPPAATAVVTGNLWNATGLAAASTHSYRLAYVLSDGRRSPLSGATTNTTYNSLWYYNAIPQEWMTAFFGPSFWLWPSPDADSDGDGVSNKNEFLAGTDPMDANSVLRQRMEQTSQGVFLKWNTQPGLIYQIQRSGSFGSWSNYGGLRFAAGHEDSVLVPPGFYRISRLR